MKQIPLSWWRQIIREPFVHFVLLGGLLYLLYINFSKPGPTTIVISKQKTQNLIGALEQELGRSLTKAERKQLLEEYVDEEVLLQEAYKQGMDQNDPRIRKRMIDKMKFSLYKTTETPNEKALRTFYEKHKKQYAAGEKISFEHIFFTKSLFKRQNDIDSILSLLNHDANPESFGTEFPVGREFASRSRMELIRIFGTSFVNKLENLPLNRWYGPIDSKQGIHFVRVKAKHITGYLPFDAVKPSVLNDYIQWQQKSELQHKIDSIKSGYKIIIEPFDR